MSPYSYTDRSYVLAETLLFKLDVPPKLQGFGFLAEAIAIRANDSRSRFLDIYARIAADHGIAWKTASNSMIYAIYHAPTKLGRAIDRVHGDVFLSKVIATLALQIKNVDCDPVSTDDEPISY